MEYLEYCGENYILIEYDFLKRIAFLRNILIILNKLAPIRNILKILNKIEFSSRYLQKFIVFHSQLNFCTENPENFEKINI